LGDLNQSRVQLDSVLLRQDRNLPASDEALLQLERGKVDFDQERFSESIPYFRKAQELAPENSSAVLYMAGALFRVRRFSDAAEYYLSAHDKNPRDAKTTKYLGISLLEAGKLKEAEKHLMSVLKTSEEDASLYYYLSRVHEGLGNKAEAIADLEKALQKDPNYRNAQIRLVKMKGE
jgi:tetratricopeptide (TPR) repeat protein